MLKPPKPTGLKTTTSPPRSKSTDRATFTYEPDEKEPALDDTHPRLAALLHIVVMSALFAIVFFLGATFVLIRGHGHTTPIAIFSAIAGGIFFAYKFHQLTKP